MDALVIVIILEAIQFPLQISSVPEQDLVQEFVANGADEPFHKRMR